jgi:hypothetical protein
VGHAVVITGVTDAPGLVTVKVILITGVTDAPGLVTVKVILTPGAWVLFCEPHRTMGMYAQDARLLVMGLSDRWRTEGIGPVRLAVAAAVPVPILVVRHGLRPSGIAPHETFTRFTRTLAGGRGEKSR